MMKLKIIGILLILICLGGLGFAAAPTVSQFSYDPSPAVPGDIINVLIQVENYENNEKTDVQVKIEDQYPFTVQEEPMQELGTMEKYGKTIVIFKVYVDPSAENKTYQLPISISSNRESGKTIYKDIIISGKEANVKVINISDPKLIPGQEKNITFEIQNVGTSSAYDVIVELEEDRTIVATGAIVEREITPLGSALAYIEKLDPKTKANVSIILSVNREADLKNYTLPVTITYRNSSGTTTTQTSYVGLKISGNVDLDLTLKESVILIAGQTQTLTMELFNKGFGKAEFTIAELELEGATVDKPKQFIGSLEPNDVDSFKTEVTIDANAITHDAIIKTKLNYQDTDATMKTVVLEIPVKIYSAADGAAAQGINPFSGIINIVIILLIIVGGWKGYKIYKSKKQ